MNKIFLAVAITSLSFASTLSAAPKVLSSIYPLQQIANAIVGEPTELLADSYISPHEYAVKPMDAKKIREADILLWVGAAMMPQLDKYVDQRTSKQVTLTASKLPDIHLLKGDHHHHEVVEHGEVSHVEHEHHHESEFNYDPHLWLSTENAQAIAMALSQALVEKDSDHAALYTQNLQNFIAQLDATKKEITQELGKHPVPKYFVFHSAYAYFEGEFGIAHSGVISMHAGQKQKAQALNDLKDQLQDTPQACLFREPQFDSKIVKRLVAVTDVKEDVLDPVGYHKDENIGYTQILKNIAHQIMQCRQ